MINCFLLLSFEFPDSSLVLVQYERAVRHEAKNLEDIKVKGYLFRNLRRVNPPSPIIPPSSNILKLTSHPSNHTPAPPYPLLTFIMYMVKCTLIFRGPKWFTLFPINLDVFFIIKWGRKRPKFVWFSPVCHLNKDSTSHDMCVTLKYVAGAGGSHRDLLQILFPSVTCLEHTSRGGQRTPVCRWRTLLKVNDYGLILRDHRVRSIKVLRNWSWSKDY